MTEDEWLECGNPESMLYFLQDSASERKYRLFAVACCHRIWHLMEDERSRTLVDITELHVDNLADDAEWEEASRDAQHALNESGALVGPELYGRIHSPLASEHADLDRLLHTANTAAWALGAQSLISLPGRWGLAVACLVAKETAAALSESTFPGPETMAQCDLLREIFGPSAFRKTQIEPSWFTSDVVEMSQAIYDDGLFYRMPILADALMDAGCDNEEIIVHCRQTSGHVRGCWVLDLLLGKS